MAALTIEFLDNLAQAGHQPLLERVDATVRFDVADGGRSEHRLVRIDHGDIRVSAEDGPADSVVAGDHEVLDAIVDGRTTPIAALLRGQLDVGGDPELLALTQRLFAAPPAASSGRAAVAGGRRTS